jgi:tRNA(Ile)-lysidine synthase
VSGPHRAIAATRLAVRRALARLALEQPDQVGRARLVSQPDQAAHLPLVLVACSGGPDSLALAAAVAFEAPRAGLHAGAVIVDHDLQEGSLAAAGRAADQCRSLGLDPVELVSVEVRPSGSAQAGSGSGPESRARDARYGAFEEVARRLGAVAVLLGHTRDDQAEQVLLGLARGSGARSLSGMPARRGRYLRPLLGVGRATTVAACAAAGLTVWVDPHNSDPAYGRVRARGLLPVLEAGLGPGTVVALARTADLLREDADALDDFAAQARAELGQGGSSGVEAAALLGHPHPGLAVARPGGRVSARGADLYPYRVARHACHGLAGAGPDRSPGPRPGQPNRRARTGRGDPSG